MNLDELKGEALFSYLRTNREELVQQKRTSLAYDSSIRVAKLQNLPTELELQSKDTLDVTVVCSTAWICNSHMDVLTDRAYDKSIAARGASIPHIHDHEHECTAYVADTKKVYTSTMSVRDLGYNSDEKTTVLLMDSTVRKDYNEDVFKFYASGKINQHSIGFTYRDIKFAVNSDYEQDAAEKAVWDEYYPKIINKEAVDSRGYFWLVDEVDVLENSCVLFGSNVLTPTLSIASLDKASKEILSLGNKEEPVITQPLTIGKTIMTLEEALGEIISLKTELATAKAEIGIAKASARLEEKTRTIGILKAQTTFGSEDALKEAALEFITEDYDLKAATSMLEKLKGHIQKASHVDTTEATLKATQLKSTPTGEASFEEGLLVGLKSLGEQPQLFKGVR